MIAYHFLQKDFADRNGNQLVCLAITGTLMGLLVGCGGDGQIPGAQDPEDTAALFAGTPMFFIQKPVPQESTRITDPTAFTGNAKLIMKDRAEAGAREETLSDRAFSGNYDVRDLDVSFDGDLLLFAMRAPQLEDAEDDEQPTWNLWEYDITTNQLYRLISSDITAEKGHDITPRYVNESNDIVFASTRQDKSQSILRDEGKPGYSALEEDGDQPALNLHLLTRNSSTIRQISFNMSHDLYPAVMSDGKIVYSRWDNFSQDNLSLYRMYPDGTQNELLYGHHSHATGPAQSNLQFIRPYELPDGTLSALARPMEAVALGGDFISIDVENYIDNEQPTARTNGNGPAQQSLTISAVDVSSELSPGGRYSAFFPLNDATARALVSWEQCRVASGELILSCSEEDLAAAEATAAASAYGIWMLDLDDQTQVPVVPAKDDLIITDIVLAASRNLPFPYSWNESLQAAVDAGKIDDLLVSELVEPATELGIIHIHNVYDINGTADEDYSDWANPSLSDAADRPGRFLRIVKGVPEPDNDTKQVANGSFGRANAQRMKEILGYAPIEPDGSVKVMVPANVPLMVSITDADGQRISPRHQNWIWLRPGEVMECKGCHERNDETPHGRYETQADSSNANVNQPLGSSYPGATATIVAPFVGATMAEARADADTSIMTLNPNLIYQDVWTDSNVEAPDPDLQLRYEDMPIFDLWSAAEQPANSNCSPLWNGRCRIIINYEDHIQPLWELVRDATSVDPGFEAATQHDNGTTTCVRCHSITDELGQSQIPPGQLELTNELDGSNGIQIRSYVELFFNDVEKVLEGTTVVDCTMEVPRQDDDGNPVFDENGVQLFDTVTCPATIEASMSSAGAGDSAFFDVFNPVDGSHRNYLSPAELRLISEWLDIGGQYYNSHFDAPDN